MKLVTLERLKELLSYNPETGDFHRVKFASSNGKKGDKAGYIRKDNYVQLSIDSTLYQAHRVAWFYVHGSWPKNLIDHINGNRSDNRICNLREATDAQNQHNEPLRKSNKSGVKNVFWETRKSSWCVRIYSNNKCFNFGN